MFCSEPSVMRDLNTRPKQYSNIVLSLLLSSSLTTPSLKWFVSMVCCALSYISPYTND